MLLVCGAYFACALSLWQAFSRAGWGATVADLTSTPDLSVWDPSQALLLLQVCNHPDLFEGRSIISAFDMLPAISTQEPSAVLNLCQQDPASTVSLGSVGSAGPALQSMSAWEAAEVQVCGHHAFSPAHAPESAHEDRQRLIRAGLKVIGVQQNAYRGQRLSMRALD